MATYTLRVDTPDGDTDNPAQADDEMRLIKNAIIERLAVDHVMVTSATDVYDGADNGKHDQVTLIADNTPGAVAAGEGVMHAAADATSGNLELAWTDEDEETLQITKGGKFNLLVGNLPDDQINEDAIELQNNNYLVAANIAGDGDTSLIKAYKNGSDEECAILPDKTMLATDAAPVLDPDVANKKYVDDRYQFDAWTANDSVGGAIDSAYGYTANGDGFFYCTMGSSGTARIYIDGTEFFYGNGAAGTKNVSIPISAGEVLTFAGSPFYMYRWKGINGSKLVKN